MFLIILGLKTEMPMQPSALQLGLQRITSGSSLKYKAHYHFRSFESESLKERLSWVPTFLVKGLGGFLIWQFWGNTSWWKLRRWLRWMKHGEGGLWGTRECLRLSELVPATFQFRKYIYVSPFPQNTVKGNSRWEKSTLILSTFYRCVFHAISLHTVPYSP